MDSGSADFWVGAENCQAAQEQAGGGSGAGGGQGASARGLQRRKGGKGSTSGGAQDCGNHSFLGQQSSSSFVDTQQPFEVTYGSGAVAGTVVTDNVNLAGLALNNHTFGTAQQETVQFTEVLYFISMVNTTISDCSLIGTL
jgi:Eukaryotic aspartyl protease